MNEATFKKTNNGFRKSLPIIKSKWCVVTHSGFGINATGFIPETGFTALSQHWNRQFKKYAYFKLLTEKKKIYSSKNILSLHNHWSAGYHHWLIEVLLKICLLKNQKNYSLLLPESYPKFAFDSLAAFQFKEVVNLPKKTGLLTSKVTFVGNPKSGFYNKVHVEILKNTLIKYVSKIKSNDLISPRVYVSRAKAKNRKVLNEVQLLPVLKEFDFKIIYLEDLSFWEQVKLFISCEILITIHGAALTNMIFQPEGAKVIELNRTGHSEGYDPCFYNLASVLSVEYHQIQFDFESKKGDRKQDFDLDINKNEFKKLISSIIK